MPTEYGDRGEEFLNNPDFDEEFLWESRQVNHAAENVHGLIREEAYEDALNEIRNFRLDKIDEENEEDKILFYLERLAELRAWDAKKFDYTVNIGALNLNRIRDELKDLWTEYEDEPSFDLLFGCLQSSLHYKEVDFDGFVRYIKPLLERNKKRISEYLRLLMENKNWGTLLPAWAIVLQLDYGLLDKKQRQLPGDLQKPVIKYLKGLPNNSPNNAEVYAFAQMLIPNMPDFPRHYWKAIIRCCKDMVRTESIRYFFKAYREIVKLRVEMDGETDKTKRSKRITK